MFRQPLKIIWNITNKCGYDCDICATSSDREEISYDEKKEVLESILTIDSLNIAQIDFSGGDPLFSQEAVDIVYRTSNILGKEKVSVTTTGKGIESAYNKGEDLSKLLFNCEITIDSPDQIPVYLRNDSSYVETNRKAIKYAVREINGLTVNVPILDPQMDYKKIKKLVDEIAQIESKHISVNLIRLMNVGKMNHKDYPVIYLPEAFIESFKECAKGTRIKNIHIHCALRGKILGMQCNMLTEKLGIDCSGNVFSCIWGGYIKGYDRNNISDNPFYIGNLLQNSLSEVLEGKRAKELEKLIKTNPTSHCRVFCCGKGNLWLEDDPLFKL